MNRGFFCLAVLVMAGASRAFPQVPWSSHGHDAQHTGYSAIASQPLNRVKWSTPVDLVLENTPGELLIHYGTPIITAANTVLVPVRTNSSNNYQVNAFAGGTGTLKYTLTTDYTPPPHDWTPSYGICLSARTRVWYPGAGGTVYYRDTPDSNTGPSGQIAFFGNAVYAANQTGFQNSVAISTPIVSDRYGDIFFGFIVTGSPGLKDASGKTLVSGLARISYTGAGSWTGATTLASDASITQVQMNGAPALSADSLTLYLEVNSGGVTPGYLVSASSTTLAPIQHVRATDPETGNNALILDDSSAEPTVGPDGDVYFGVFESDYCCNNDDRGWMLHYDKTLTQKKIPGAFGWDATSSIVPSGLVPSYQGSSSYLIFTKYNNYAGLPPGGNGHNEVAVLDPNATEVDPITGATVMQEVITILGDTLYPAGNSSGEVREWCISSGAIDGPNKSALVNSEDGYFYRWDFTTNTFTQKLYLTPGVAEAYTPTVIGVDGTAYAINDAVLFAVGQ